MVSSFLRLKLCLEKYCFLLCLTCALLFLSAAFVKYMYVYNLETNNIFRSQNTDIKNTDKRCFVNITNVEVYEYPMGRIKVGPRNVLLQSQNRPNFTHWSLLDIGEYSLTALYAKEADCTTYERFGKKVDGGWHVCLVEPMITKNLCTVLSFGINFDFSFDDDMVFRMGCKVFSFDPTMNVKSHIRNDQNQFFRLGLYGFKTVLEHIGPVDTLSNIRRSLELDNSIIDVLKIDIELSEYSALTTALADGSLHLVRQLLVEFHSLRREKTVSEAEQLFSLLDGLYEQGFRLWHTNWNYHCTLHVGNRHFTLCTEMYFINSWFLKEKYRRPDIESWWNKREVPCEK